MEWVSGNIFIRPALEHAPAGFVLDGHTHNFDHTSIVFHGAVRVEAILPDGRKIAREFVAPAHFLVRKDVRHTITALTDDTTLWCVYSHRSPQGDVIEEYDGWRDAYL